MNQLFIVWALQAAGVKPFAYFSNETIMVLEAPGVCCESIIDDLESPGGWCEAICKLFNRIIYGFKLPMGCCEAICTVFELVYLYFDNI